MQFVWKAGSIGQSCASSSPSLYIKLQFFLLVTHDLIMHNLNDLLQLNNVVTGIQNKLGIQKAPLILIHHRRTKGGPAASSFATKALNKWIDGNSIYTTPTGSNDDWYVQTLLCLFVIS